MGIAKMTSRGREPTSMRRAFTLVEMLVVIGIIVILVSLAVVTGTKVIAGGKARASEDVIRVLDESRATWMLNWDKPLPAYLELDPQLRRAPIPIIDARPAASGDWSAPAHPSLTYYTALVLQDPMIAPIFQQLDSAFVKPTTAPLPDNTGQSNRYAFRALEITDAWGRPFRFVHPEFHGGHGPYWDAERETMESQRDVYRLPQGMKYVPNEFRRSYRPFNPDNVSRKSTWIGDADEGMCPGNTPYFYSPGEDGDPGTRDDNAYSTVPQFPVETRDFE